MSDPRVRRLADILVNYSTGVRRGSKVKIRLIDEGLPLLKEVYRLCIKNGAHVRVDMGSSDLDQIFIKHASNAQLSYVPSLTMAEAKWLDCHISIMGLNNTKYMTNVDPRRMVKRSQVLRPVSSYIVNNKKWVFCNFPSHALAQDAGMSLEEYEDFLYSACNVNWRLMSAKQIRLKKVLDRGRMVRILGPGTDLCFSITGRRAVKCDGKMNMPDGEVFIAPDEKTTHGHITYDYPAVHRGKEVEGIRLVFSRGRVTQATARTNQSYLNAMINSDPGARRVGEFGIGTNYAIKTFTKDILFDEKIGGTVHLALGMAYKEGGGRNKSAIHWDMIKDLRKGGSIEVDGRTIQKNGKFLI
jgi:aminopeptidase